MLAEFYCFICNVRGSKDPEDGVDYLLKKDGDKYYHDDCRDLMTKGYVLNTATGRFEKSDTSIKILIPKPFEGDRYQVTVNNQGKIILGNKIPRAKPFPDGV